jgi:uncharacterized protein YjbJ (UPF0337 family)
LNCQSGSRGSAKQVKGAVKQVLGKVVGDTKQETEGNADKIEGKVQNAIGGLKDSPSLTGLLVDNAATAGGTSFARI